MSQPIYHEQISADVARALIGEDNLKASAEYYMITEVSKTVIMRRESNGEETEFPLAESEFTGYEDDGICDFAKLETVIKDDKPKGHLLKVVFGVTMLIFLLGVGCIVALYINF